MEANERSEMDALWQDFRKTVARRKAGRIAGYVLTAAMFMVLPFALLRNEAESVPQGDSMLLADATDQVCLNDGTKVTLTDGSSIFYPETFKETERRVRLAGAGYFEVQSSPERPFIIDVPGGFIKVTGTKFMATVVSENRIKVSLDEGRIELGCAGGESVIVYPSEEVEFDTQTGQVIHTALTFRDDSLETVLEEVGRIYGFSTVFEDYSLKSIRLLFRIPKYRDSAKVLDLIQAVCDVRMTLSDGVVRVWQDKTAVAADEVFDIAENL